ncbi:penicillin-binding protein activator [Thiomicrorhabdus indica]|uniref:penicillin-binding protein activator n=1 Tax=Thiomicrorhabdus indica TaxID=2267253 RepID=UPI002AA790FA|nr:hypothetical protein [Thiomicrorhabdus indica]
MSSKRLWKNWVKTLNVIGLGVASLCLSPATFAFEWMEETPVFIFGEPTEEDSSASRKNSAHSEDSRSENNKTELQQQINQIDLEILMLKAELALQNSDLKGLQNYLEELEGFQLPPGFQERFNELKGQLNAFQPNQILQFFGLQQAFEFPMSDPNAVVAVVLPFTGKYTNVSQQLFSSLNQALQIYGYQGRIVRFDTMAYPNVFRLWEALRSSSPSFIFGPLQKETIDDWHRLDTGIPTLYFNDVEQTLFSYEKALSPSSLGSVRKLAKYLADHQYEHAVVLMDDTKKAKELADDLAIQWQNYSPNSQLMSYTIGNNFSQSFSEASGVSNSENRATVLQRIVRRPIEAERRARQDIQVVISIAAPAKSIQVAPLLKFHGLGQVEHIWLPSRTIQVRDLNLYLNSWQSTMGLLPQYLYQSYLDQAIEDNFETGIFYALGQVAVEIVNQAEFLSQKDWLLMTENGQVEANRDGRFYLLPSMYWLDKQEILPVESR